MSVTPYSKNSTFTTGNSGQPWGGDGYHPYLVEHGYINLVVDARGTGSSQGMWGFENQQEMQDGVEIAQWADRQLPGSNGVIGGTDQRERQPGVDHHRRRGGGNRRRRRCRRHVP